MAETPAELEVRPAAQLCSQIEMCSQLRSQGRMCRKILTTSPERLTGKVISGTQLTFDRPPYTLDLIQSSYDTKQNVSSQSVKRSKEGLLSRR